MNKTIENCCYYCKHLEDCMGLKDIRGKPCYNAMGGKEYMKHCDVKDSKCNTKCSTGEVIGDVNSNCWEVKK